MKFDIPAQSAATAIPLFIQQANVQVMFVHDELKDVPSNAVIGEHEPFDALALLVQGTGFTATKRNGSWFAVVRTPAEKPGSIEGTVTEEKSSRPVAGARVTLAGTTRSVRTDKRGRFTLDGVAPGDHILMVLSEGMQDTKVTDVTVKPGHRLSLSAIGIPVKKEGPLQLEDFVVSAKKNDGVIELDPYSVEGKREKTYSTANLDIPRTISDVQPYYIFDANIIEHSGSTNVEDFLKQRLTMNSSALSSSQNTALSTSGSNSYTTGNISAINLRGVGADKTLILINGRRSAGVAILDTNSQPDLNGIPLGSIERIEVLPSSASGIYGGSAIGGVVNVILKRDYKGGEVRLGYDNSWDTDTAKRTVTVNYGVAFEGGKSHLNISSSFSDMATLLLQDRKTIFATNIEKILKNSPGFITSSTSPWLGALPNIAPQSPAQTTLTLKNGTPLNSSITHIAPGTSLTTPLSSLRASLLANAGSWDLNLPPTTQGPTGLLRPFGVTPQVKSIQASLRRQMMPRIELYADVSYSQNKSSSVRSAFSGTVNVPVSAPTNPFTTSVRVQIPDSTVAPLSTTSTNRSATIGAVFQLPWSWTGLLDYMMSNNRFSSLFYLNDNTPLNADIANGVLNPFVDTVLYPIDIQKYIRPVSYKGEADLQNISLRANGPIEIWPWCRANMTVGLDYTITKTPENTLTTIYPLRPTFNSNQTFYARKTKVASGYSEMDIPLISAKQIPAFYSLNLQLAGRFDRYDVSTGTPSSQTFYNQTPVIVTYNAPTLNGKPFTSSADYQATNFTVGLRYQPTPDFILRASRATAFLPPSPVQLIEDPTQNTTTLASDPVTGRTNVAIFTVGGGNPELKPQHSTSFNLGLVWEPKSDLLRNLRVDIEYYKIEQQDAISNLSAQQIVTLESVFPGRVTRDSSQNITLVDISSLNLYKRDTEGWDISLDYSLKTRAGSFNLRAVTSVTLHLKQQYALTLPEFDAVNFPSENGGAKIKGNASLTWERGGLITAWTARYFSAYKQFGASGGPTDTQVRATNSSASSFTTYTAPQGGDDIPSQIYHDLFIGYNFGQRQYQGKAWSALSARLINGVSVQVGVRNIFGQEPPFDVYYGGNYYLSPYGDTRLRTYWLNVKKAF